ncbi:MULTISPECIES: pyridoxal phosphate-dependent decarboxylase family protein [Amycolatopsis]|uniref:Pyridoxal phosphate-dependent decarboxylase family protein n=1 Tax=Amycolatopsis albidoflavus TaxID=102226 RepID=A0ABW5HT58_9PSEU
MSLHMHEYDEQLTSLVFDHLRNRLRRNPVELDCPAPGENVASQLEGILCPGGNDPEYVLKLYNRELMRTVVSADSPRYLSFIPCAPTKAAQLGEMLVSADSLQGIFWMEAAGAIVAENQVLRLIADQAKLPETAGGCFVTGGSAANLSALVVARDTARRRLGLPVSARFRVAVSEETHSSVTNSLNIICAEKLVVPTDDHRLTGEALRAALEADNDPAPVIAVVGTAGTTNAGLIDDLSGIARVAKANDMWFHVDGAYGGAGLFAPTVRQRFAGIECVDSFVVDPHKWLFAPFDCAALIYRNPQLAKSVHTQAGPYLDLVQAAENSPEWNPPDYAYHLTRSACGLPLWFSLAVHGIDAYREAIESGIALAKAAADLIRDEYKYLEVIREPELSCLIYRRPGWTATEYRRWSRRLLADQVGFVVPTSWEGEVVTRLAFLHPGTTLEMIREILDSMREAPA